MNKQRGMGILGIFFLLVLLVGGAIVGMKMVPAYLEFFAVKKVLHAMKSEIQGASVRDVKMAFDRRASIDDIKSITGNDLDISKEGNDVVVNASYQVKVPLFANISVLLDFNASSQ